MGISDNNNANRSPNKNIVNEVPTISKMKNNGLFDPVLA
jgi:hypothetical protein